MKKFYITTPIYYINDIPHIGHGYNIVACDTLARYYQAKGKDVFFMTGVDEHGAKIAEAAKANGLEPQDFVDGLVPKFKEAWKSLNINYSAFFRTTDPKHEEEVQSVVKRLQQKGYIEKREYEGLYCVGCERFYKEDELKDGLCPDHLKAPVLHSEENYFFLLSRFARDILEKIESGELEVAPKARKNEIVGKIKQGLEDISVSRAGVSWGIPFPGDDKQTIYVWVDALLNYYTAEKVFDSSDLWPADLHVVGKDIIWFHAIIWPAILLALDLPLPKKIYAHGFFTVNGQKMSKTLGNILDPKELVKEYGADPVRYYLLSAFPFGEDGDVSLESLRSSYQKLSNDIGNLLQRTLSMINKYGIEVKGVIEKNSDDSIDIDKEMSELDFMNALRKITGFCEEQNKYIAKSEPWVLAKEGKNKELAEVLTTVYKNLYRIANSLEPFMPDTALKMKTQLKSLNPEPIFPRIDLR